MLCQVDRLDAQTLRWRIGGAGGALSCADVLAGWLAQPDFRDAWIDGLRRLPLAAYCWECPPLSAAVAGRPFECVFVDCPALAGVAQDADTFAAHFRGRGAIAEFGNLGGDAWLVAPEPGPPGADYAHLARFAATAPAAQQHALWQAVGAALTSRLGGRPVWLSTSGFGVAWLHVRLDERPKYYRHAAYAEPR